MSDLSVFLEPGKVYEFKVDYPYYGLFYSAEIVPLDENGETIYECKLRNGKTMVVKKVQQYHKWIDVNLNTETPLSSVIGTSIEDFLRK